MTKNNMTATAHAIIGTVIASKIGNPYLAIPLALLSHLAADLVPHWDVATNRAKKSRRKLILDAFSDVILGFATSFAILAFVFPQTNPLYAFFMIIVAQSFDWFTAPYYFFGIKKFKWAYDFGKKFDREQDKPWGIINQIGILVLLIILAKVF